MYESFCFSSRSEVWDFYDYKLDLPETVNINGEHFWLSQNIDGRVDAVLEVCYDRHTGQLK